MTGQSWLWTPPRPTPAPVGVGQLLRAYRQAHGLTQQQLADQLGFDQSYVSKVESGRRAIHDISTLRHIARHLDLAPEDVGLAPGALADRRREIGRDTLAEQATASQRAWRVTRDTLNRNRIKLAKAAAGLYPDTYRLLGSGLLTRSDWTWQRPLDISEIGLRWSDELAEPTITGGEPETDGARPLIADGGPFVRYQRYTRAMRDLDRPTLFENRLSFRLLDVTRDDRGVGGDAGRPVLTFGHTTYFDAVDVCETVAHETATAMMAGGLSWPALPFRRRIGDPFDLAARPVLPSINTLTIRADRDSASFLLHRRSAGSVATAGGVYHVIPAGVFQPSGITPFHHRADFDLWRNIMRELSEELLGNTEHDGNSSNPIDYEADEPFRAFEQARNDGRIQISCFGVGLDALTLFSEILTVVVIEADAFDAMFAEMVHSNAEGSVVSAGPNHPVADGIPFTYATLRRLVDSEPLAPAAAACLELAWRHRELLLPGLRLRAAS
ncbi:helix-turn-helix transcriptional regulator [Frankia sp. CNm7]|uniref:Helix-turn-helix transcriptional regulator n=1 Tax=Frankia nepalensis TaxID=1836974 RepID=A0A937UQK8_9ACTN|nr:helix-turn-helix domain-containing protein [Frankia nepalensis]MBL7495533.1 helix-turn-helix transcriptional regulator [Frankia nepalensis]MBL7509814.1 helix-turn-helix transcriptional regulator [Frankia nepalensis]MBL7517521.1 helix-turn-helix transcriptional regulator [Frankia nepalensis]MBL7626806.1 helix-turn-helix transcriptional regulator [Frankia nepalensis]